MNTLTVDGRQLSANDFSGANLEEILLSLMEHPAISNRFITKVLVNGDFYSEEVPHAAMEVERAEIDTLELITHSPEDLSLHFLENGHYFVNTMRQTLPKIVEEFRLGDEMEANEHFLTFLESLHLLISMLEQSKMVMGISDDIELGAKGSLNAFLEKLGSTLTILADLQEQSDWIYLADVLEYELDGALSDLSEILPLLKTAAH